MGVDTAVPNGLDPRALSRAAHALREMGVQDATPGALEEALLHAHRRVASDLAQLTARQAEKATLDYRALLGAQFHEKIAALLLLCKYTLFDLAQMPRAVRDIELAHHHLALFAEIFFRTEAVDALATLYDFALAQLRGRSANAQLWQNVCAHALMLLAMLETQRPRVIAFLRARAPARKQLGQLVSFTRPALVDALCQALERALREPAPPTEPPAPYLKLLAHYDPDVPYDGALGACSALFAVQAVTQRLAAGDRAEVQRWFVAGSDAAAAAVLRQARATLSATAYRHLLEALLHTDDVPPARLAACVQEIGALNRAERPDGGVGEANRILFEVAMTAERALAGVARLAVNELRAVHNIDGLMVLIEQAPLQRVAEDGVLAMLDLRRLLLVEPLVAARPPLTAVYQEAKAQQLEIERIMDAVWMSDDPDTIARCVSRLEELHATPELRKISELAERQGQFYGHRSFAEVGAG